MTLGEFLSSATEILAEMQAEPSTKQVDITDLKNAMDLLEDYATDAAALEQAVEELPRYVWPYRDVIQRIESTYYHSSQRAKTNRFIAAVAAATTIGKFQTVLKEVANEAGLAFIPVGRIVLECGSADEINVR